MDKKKVKIIKWFLITIVFLIYLSCLTAVGRYVSMKDEIIQLGIANDFSQELKNLTERSAHLYYIDNDFKNTKNIENIKNVFKNNLEYIKSITITDKSGQNKSVFGELSDSKLYSTYRYLIDNDVKGNETFFAITEKENKDFYIASSTKENGYLQVYIIEVDFNKFKAKIMSRELDSRYVVKLVGEPREIKDEVNYNIEESEYRKKITLGDREYDMVFQKTHETIEENKNKVLVMGIVSLVFFMGLTTLGLIFAEGLREQESIEIEEVDNKDEDIAETIQERYKLVIEGANDIIWIYNVKSKTIEVSHRLSEILEGDIKIEKDGVYSSMCKIIYEEDLDGVMDACNSAVEGLVTYVQKEFRMQIKGGEIHWFLLRGRTLKDENGDVISIAGSLTDINEYRLNENKIRYLSYYDTLTGIPNIKSFTEKFEEHFIKNNNQYGALIICDIDDLRSINNIMGQNMGDQVIKETSYRLMCYLNLRGFISRVSGDEFGIIFYEVKNENELKEICESIVELFYEDLHISGNNITSTVSVGASLYGVHGKCFDEVFRHANMALAKAKEHGESSYKIFNEILKSENLIKLNMEKNLKNDLKERKLELYYQPKINLKDKSICGFEALMRWTSNGKHIKTSDFIKLAEERGIMDIIGIYAMEEACKQIAIWKNNNIQFKSVAVNISPIHIKKNEFICTLASIMKIYDINAGELEIEITESPFADDINELKEKIKCIVDMGVNVSLGNFGKGYSSLECFLNIPITAVKIDKNILLGENKVVNESVIEAITQLCHKIGLKVVAEGVETKEQFESLYDFCCDVAQGYYIAKPMAAYQVQEYIEKYEI